MSSIKVPDTYDPSLPINSDPADGGELCQPAWRTSVLMLSLVGLAEAAVVRIIRLL